LKISDRQDIYDVLETCPLFAGLGKGDLGKIASSSDLVILDKGRILFCQGDPATAFYVVVSGKMRVYKMSSSGREQTLATIGPGVSIAEAALFDNGSYPAYSDAVEKSELIKINKKNFLDLIAGRPQIALNMIALLSVRLRKFTTKIEQLSLMGVLPRLADYISRNSDGKSEFELDISKGELASLLGTVPETLSRAFGKLKSGEYIEESGNTIRIISIDGLRELAKNHE